MATMYKIIFGNNSYNELFLQLFDLDINLISNYCDITIDENKRLVIITVAGLYCPPELIENKNYVDFYVVTILSQKYAQIVLRVPNNQIKNYKNLIAKNFALLSDDLKNKIKENYSLHYVKYFKHTI